MLRKLSRAVVSIGTAVVITAGALTLAGWPFAQTAAGTEATPRLSSVSRTTAKVATAASTRKAAKPARKRATPQKRVKPKKRTVKTAWRSARASWYGPGFYGNTMAGGGRLKRNSMVVAHRSLPFGTKLQIRFRGRVVTAVVRDRGPYVGGRQFDLGPGTARELGFGGVGTIDYRIVKRR